MAITFKLAARNLAAHRTRYFLAGTSVAFGVAFMVTAKLVTDSLSAQVGDASTLLVLLGMFGLIVLVAAGFVIANSFSSMIAARTRELAVLRAVGGRTSQLLANVVIEGMLLGVLGAGTGVVMGTAGAWAIEHFAMHTAVTPPGLGTIAVALAVGIGTDLVAVVLPARRASAISPMAALSAAELAEATPVPRGRIILGALTLAGGLALAALPASPQAALVVFLVGAMIAFVGLALLAPALVAPVVNRIGGLAARALGGAGELGGRPQAVMAIRNLARSPRRVANSAVSVALGVTLFTGMVAVANSLAVSIQASPQDMAAMYRVTLALTGLTILIGVVGVVNTITMGINERARERAMLRATGMTARQLQASLLTEGLFIALLGIASGLILGLGGSALLVTRIGVGLAVPLAGLTVLTLATLGLVLLVTAVPAMRAGRVSPVAALVRG